MSAWEWGGGDSVPSMVLTSRPLGQHQPSQRLLKPGFLGPIPEPLIPQALGGDLSSCIANRFHGDAAGLGTTLRRPLR